MKYLALVVTLLATPVAAETVRFCVVDLKTGEVLECYPSYTECANRTVRWKGCYALSSR